MPDPNPQGVYLTPEQFQTLQRGQLLLQKLSQTPSTKRSFERLVKEIVPEVQTTADIVQEEAAPYIEQITAVGKKLDDFLAAQEAREAASADAAANASLSEAFVKLRAEGLTEAGEAEVKKAMVERNIADPYAAFALWERNNPKPPEGLAAWEPDSWNFAKNAVGRNVDELFKNPDLWADEEVGHVLADLRRPQQS